MNPGGHHPRLVDYATGSLFWVELCPPKRHVEALTPSTCDCDLVWKQGLGVPESGGSSALCGYLCPYERRRRRDTQGEGHATAGAGAGAERPIGQPRTQALGKAGEGSPKGPGGVRPASPGAQTSPTSPSGRLASRHLRLRQLQAASAVAWRGFVFQGKQDPDGGLVFAPHRELRETFI